MIIRILVLIAAFLFPRKGRADPDDYEIAKSFAATQRIALQSEYVQFIGKHDGFLAPIIGTQDGGFLIVGTRSNIEPGAKHESGKSRPVVIKLDKAGKVTWEKEYKKEGFKDYEGAGAIEIRGGYLIYILSYMDPSLGYVSRFLRITSTGRIKWHHQLRGDGGMNTPFPWTAQLDKDGSLVLHGHILLFRDELERVYKWTGKINKAGKLVVDEIGHRLEHSP